MSETDRDRPARSTDRVTVSTRAGDLFCWAQWGSAQVNLMHTTGAFAEGDSLGLTLHLNQVPAEVTAIAVCESDGAQDLSLTDALGTVLMQSENPESGRTIRARVGRMMKRFRLVPQARPETLPMVAQDWLILTRNESSHWMVKVDGVFYAQPIDRADFQERVFGALRQYAPAP